MLRQRIGQLALQRLHSLVDWQAAQAQRAAAGVKRHPFSAEAEAQPSGVPDSVQYSRQRKLAEKELSKLRKQWAEERRKVDERQAAELAAAR